MYSPIHKSLEILFPFPQLSAKIEIYPSILLNSQFSLLNSMKTALSLINQAYVRGLGRTGPVRNGTDGIAAGDWEVSAVEAVNFGEVG